MLATPAKPSSAKLPFRYLLPVGAHPLVSASLVRALLLVSVLLVSACKKEAPTKVLSGERLRAACAMCIFEMKGIRACMWAVEIDGKFYLADGDLPKDHENHAPDGMCNMSRHAVVDGELVGGRFVATRFDLEPAEGVPTQPRFTPRDLH